jgi:lipoprotein-anchoring transpeptidase ErfK/SrfK
MLLPGGTLDEVAAAMKLGSRELDFRAVLRALRERVTDAAGLIEDGSAAGTWGRVLDRDLDAAAFRTTDGWRPLAAAAPDAISPATEAAARALGWTGPAETARWLESRPPSVTRRLHVAVELPPRPAYHGQRMAIRAVISRGGARQGGPSSKTRPSLVLYAETGQGELALVRWPTTIGGWQWERTPDGSIVREYKVSPLGARIWRNLIAAPVWFPPETTPPTELLTRVGGRWRLREDAVGPGYASAYGLVMLVHEHVARDARGDRLIDTEIRTHGSVNVASILRGDSHGCHRLFNHQALRLASFLLRHRAHTRRGPMNVDHVLQVDWEGRRHRLTRDVRGDLWELDPPVPVDVVLR